MHPWIEAAGAQNLVLLGAGNSASAGLPTSKQLATLVLNQSKTWHAPYAKLLQAIEDDVDPEDLNIEELHGLVVKQAELGIMSPEPTNPSLLMNFAQVASELIVDRVQQILDDESSIAIERSGFMRSLLNDSVQTVVSLNYDQLFEVTAARSGTSVSTGADLWDGGYQWPPSESRPRYLKIHGSLDWRSNEAFHVVNAGNPFLTPMIVAGKTSLTPENKTPRVDASLIFGGVNKLTSWGPYPALMNAFRDELGHAQTVTVIGYSFSDDHVNQALIRWMSLSEENRLLVIDYVKPAQEFGFFSSYFHMNDQIDLPFYEEYLREHVEFIHGDARTVVPDIFGGPRAQSVMMTAASQVHDGAYFFRHRSCELEGRLVGNGILVTAGSSARAAARPGASATILHLRNRLLVDGIADVQGDRFVLRQDYIFASPGQAADLMNGGHVREPLTLWRDSHGTSLHDTQTKE